jgi:hypothetical protein
MERFIANCSPWKRGLPRRQSSGARSSTLRKRPPRNPRRYNVVQRTTKIGVRIALGAQLKTVLWMIFRKSLILLVIGMGIGLPLAVLATRSIRNQLFGLSAIDPATFGIAIAVVSRMIILATCFPRAAPPGLTQWSPSVTNNHYPPQRTYALRDFPDSICRFVALLPSLRKRLDDGQTGKDRVTSCLPTAHEGIT